MTDPIADMLTRIRNASSVFHETVDVPASRLKVELARILKEEGFIRDYKLVDENKPQPTLRIFLKYARQQAAGHHGDPADQPPGLEGLREAGRGAPCAGWPWHCHLVDVEGRDERQGSPQSRRRRRSDLLRLVVTFLVDEEVRLCPASARCP